MDLKFFLTFIGAVAYLQDQFYDDWSKLTVIYEVDPGKQAVACQRKWTVGGINLEDIVYFGLFGMANVSCDIGHPADYDLLIAYGVYDDPSDHPDNPKPGAYWTTELVTWRPGETYSEFPNPSLRLN